MIITTLIILNSNKIRSILLIKELKNEKIIIKNLCGFFIDICMNEESFA